MSSLIETLRTAVTVHGASEFKAFIFFVDGSESKLKALNNKLKASNIALGILDGVDAEGMKLYKVNPKAKSTVFLYEDRIIKAKFVNYQLADEAKLSKKIELICK